MGGNYLISAFEDSSSFSMNSSFTLVIMLLVASVLAGGPMLRTPCKDVTFGGCDLQESKISSKKPVQTVQLCNEECYNTDNCTSYRYINETKECILATNTTVKYRSWCNIRAGPMDNDLYDCMVMNQICDSHLEEECEYSGELVKRFRQGDITGSKPCQEQCQIRA